MSTYEYVEGDFPSIISQEIWNKAQAIRESRVKPVCVSAGKNTHSKRDSRDIWVNKLRCSCGSSYRKINGIRNWTENLLRLSMLQSA